AGQRVLLVNFGRGVAATGIGDALVGAELVGAIDEAVQAEESSRFLIVPEIEDVVVGFLSHKDAWCVVRGAWCVVRGAWCVKQRWSFVFCRIPQDFQHRLTGRRALWQRFFY